MRASHEPSPCRGWRGHRFEARYDEGQAPDEIEYCGGTASAMIALLHAAKSRRYVRDVCVRCGRTIERQFSPIDLSSIGIHGSMP